MPDGFFARDLFRLFLNFVGAFAQKDENFTLFRHVLMYIIVIIEITYRGGFIGSKIVDRLAQTHEYTHFVTAVAILHREF